MAGYRVSSNFIHFKHSGGAIPEAGFETTSSSSWFCVVRVLNSIEFFKLRSRLVGYQDCQASDKDLKPISSISDSNLSDVLWSEYITIRHYEPFLSIIAPSSLTKALKTPEICVRNASKAEICMDVKFLVRLLSAPPQSLQRRQLPWTCTIPCTRQLLAPARLQALALCAIKIKLKRCSEPFARRAKCARY